MAEFFLTLPNSLPHTFAVLFPPKPSACNRVVITGAGIITAFGSGWGKNADSFRLGKSAFRPVTLFDVSRQRVKTAAEIDLPESPKTLLSARHAVRADRAAKFLLHAARGLAPGALDAVGEFAHRSRNNQRRNEPG